MGKEGKKKKTDLGEQEDQEEVHILHLPHHWLIALQGETLGKTTWTSPPLLGRDLGPDFSFFCWISGGI